MNNIWDLINVPMGYVIRFCNTLVGNNYLFALFLFAIIIEILFLPFGIKQQKNSIRQAKLKPKEVAIRKKYAGREDKQTQQAMQMEIQEMYQRENYNPLSGCLPMLIQFPILIALYNIVMNPLSYICRLSANAVSQITTIVQTFDPSFTMAQSGQPRTIELMGRMRAIMEEHGADVFSGVEGFAEKIPNVDALPDLTIFGGAIDLGGTPSFVPITWLSLIPILTFIVYFASMKLNRKLAYQASMGASEQATGCSNNVMDFSMPLMSVFITFGVPAAIAVYWMFKSILGVFKQLILKKTMPMPTFTEEDYKAAEIELGIRGGKGKNSPKKREIVEGPAKSERAGAVRSLHHIDDEDYEDTKERALRAKAAREALEAEQQEGKKLSKEAPAKLKEDRPERNHQTENDKEDNIKS